MAAMGVIEQCLSLAPVPCLGPAFGLLKSIWDVVQLVGSYKHQLRELTRSIALLLSTLNKQYQRKEPLEPSTLDSLSDLGSLLADILALVLKQRDFGFFKLLFAKDDIQLAINSYQQRMTAAVRNFQITALLDIQGLQQQNSRARKSDHDEVLNKLGEIETNQNLLVEELKGQKKDPLLTMAALQNRLRNRQGDEAELRFFSRSLDYIEKTYNGSKLEYEQWMVTSLEVEFGRVISKGGFGIIYEGKWKGADVALKVLKNPEGVTPDGTDLQREIKTWSRLRHPNVLQFIGASVFDDEPFIVMPLIKHGNVRDYLDKNPDCNRINIIHQIALGIFYLHSKNVIHGDLKAANVLIDDGEKPLLCDFGLSRIKEDVDSRSHNGAVSTARGSSNWMAPERLEGRTLRKPCDIYSFAMTMYEIHTNSNPLGSLPPNDFREVIAVQHKRPERPDDDEAPQLTEDAWRLITRCWAPEPMDRPVADTVCAELAHMKISAINRHTQRRAPNFPSYQSTPETSRYGQNSETSSRRQTTESSRPSNQRRTQNRAQKHFHQSISEPSHLPNAQNPLQIIPESHYHAEPMEMEFESSFGNPGPLTHPPNSQPHRKNTSNHYDPNNADGYAPQGVAQASRAFVNIPISTTQYSPPPLPPHVSPPYPSPPHSSASYGPPASIPVQSSYSGIQTYNAANYLQNPNLDNPPLQSTYPSFQVPVDPVHPPVKNYTVDAAMHQNGLYPSYSGGPYGHPTQPPQISSRSQTLPVPPYYQHDRASSPDPSFPQPSFHYG